MKAPGKRTAYQRGARTARANPPAARGAANPDVMEENLLDSLLLALKPIEPARKAALKASIVERAHRAEPATDVHYENTVTIRSEGGVWDQLAPGVHMKRLHREGTARSFLLRLEAGAELPGHHHEADEECVVLEGEVFLGELRVAAGDYHLARGGTTHGTIRSPHGAVLFLRTASGVADPA
jgi:anti-sigma factor ChrR (cupin superfamily)